MIKVRNLTSHAIQFLFNRQEDGALDFLHIPEDMGQGYIIVDDFVWEQISKQTRSIEQYNEEEQTIEGILVSGKPATRKVLIGTGVFKEQSVIAHMIKLRQLELVEDENASRSAADLSALEDLEALGLSVDPNIDSDKLQKLHSRMFPVAAKPAGAVVTPTK